jgi:hypothetical protein
MMHLPTLRESSPSSVSRVPRGVFRPTWGSEPTKLLRQNHKTNDVEELHKGSDAF